MFSTPPLLPKTPTPFRAAATPPGTAVSGIPRIPSSARLFPIGLLACLFALNALALGVADDAATTTSELSAVLEETSLSDDAATTIPAAIPAPADAPTTAPASGTKSITIETDEPADAVQPTSAPPAALQAAPGDDIGQRYAVVIGINEYKDSAINLRFCVPDARLIYDILTDPARGRVPKENAALLLDADATRQNIELAFDNLVSKVKPEDMVYIYYSGHGCPGDNNLFFWVTHDADVNRLRVTSLSNDRIAEFLHDVKSNRMIQFLDCCYSLGTVAGRSGPMPLPSGDPYSSLVSQGRITFTATSGKEKAIELADLGHGAFTYYLGQALKGLGDANLDGWIDLDEAWNFLNAKVTAQAQKQGNPQHPYRFGASTFGLRLTQDPDINSRVGPLESGLALLLGNGAITKLEYNECIRILSRPPNEFDIQERQWVAQLAQGDITPDQWRQLISRHRTGSTVIATPSAPDATPPPPPTPPPVTPSPTLTPVPTPTPVVQMVSPWSRMTTKARLKLLVEALERYHADTGAVPPTGENWFVSLVQDDESPGWKGPYLLISADSPPIDNFNTPLVYENKTVRLPGRPPVIKVKVIACGVDGINDHGFKNDLVEEKNLR